jgi:hypothetical protein
MTNILVVGSLAYDDVQTPVEHRTNVLGVDASGAVSFPNVLVHGFFTKDK